MTECWRNKVRAASVLIEELNSLHTPTNLRHTLPHIFQL